MLQAIMSHIVYTSVLFLISLFIFVPYLILSRKNMAMRSNDFNNSKIKYIYMSLFIFLTILMFSFAGVPSIYDLLRTEILTSSGFHIDSNGINIIPFYSISSGIRTYIENIIFFVPLGFLLPLIWRGYKSFIKTCVFGFFVSILIEFSQIFSWRVTDIDDLITNTLGAIIGFFIYKLVSKSIFITSSRLESNESKENNDTKNTITKFEPFICVVIAFVTKFLFGSIFLY